MLSIIPTYIVPVLCLGETICPRTVDLRHLIDPEFTWRRGVLGRRIFVCVYVAFACVFCWFFVLF